MKKLLVISVAVILASGVSSHAQSPRPWTLSQCIEYARQNNLQVKMEEISVEQAEGNLTQSKWDLAPAVNAGLSHSMSWGRSVNLQTLEIIKNKRSMSTSGNLSASATIFSGFSKLNSIKSNATSLEIAREQVEKVKNDITIQITRAYLQLLLSREIERSAIESCNSTQEQVERTAKLVDAGSQAYSTLLEVQAQLANEKSQLVSASSDVRTNLLTLVQLLDLPAEEARNFDIVPPDSTLNEDILPEGTLDGIYTQALQLPQVKIAEYNLEKSKYDYKAIRARMLPSLSVQAGYGSYYTDGQSGAFFTQFEHNKNPSLGFSLSIPVFNGLSARMASRNARLASENTAIMLEVQKQSLYKEIQTAYNEAFNALERMKAARENMRSIQESFTYTENKFNVGMMNATDYNIAKTNLFKAISAYYQAKYQYLFELKILDFYKGKAINL
ncbi:MAG: TolC family protein [Bacteroidales bacterium]|nr:TolC family protein [Bacteroidales bacterium]